MSNRFNLAKTSVSSFDPVSVSLVSCNKLSQVASSGVFNARKMRKLISFQLLLVLIRSSLVQTKPQESQLIAPQDSISILKPPSSRSSPNLAARDQAEPLDANKEAIDYENSIIDSLSFIQTEKLAETNPTKSIDSILNKHHDNDNVYQYLNELAQLYPEITRLYHLNYDSVEGRKLWVLEVTEDPGRHQVLKPEFRYIGNMHGNEVVGRELILHLARLLVENYRAAQNEPANDTRPSGPKFVKKLLRSTRIHLMPTMNPDGYARSDVGCRYETPSQRGRLNANNIDLNRNFPDPIIENSYDANTQPEVRAVIEWSNSIPFSLGANLHGGALVASYPYDGSLNLSAPNQYRATPDDDVFRHLAKVYSKVSIDVQLLR